MKKLITLTLLLTAFLSFASEGEKQRSSSGTRGGADVLICKYEKKYTRTFFADTYEYEKKTRLKVDYHARPGSNLLSQEEYETVLLKTIENMSPSLKDQVQDKMNEIEWIENEDLEELDDDNITPEKGCKKAQLAIQYFDENRVEYHPERFKRLSFLDRALFRIHESLLYVKFRELVNIDNTAPLRFYLLSATVKNRDFHQIRYNYLKENYNKKFTLAYTFLYAIHAYTNGNGARNLNYEKLDRLTILNNLDTLTIETLEYYIEGPGKRNSLMRARFPENVGTLYTLYNKYRSSKNSCIPNFKIMAFRHALYENRNKTIFEAASNIYDKFCKEVGEQKEK